MNSSLSVEVVSAALRVAGDPMRLLTIAAYWAEFDEPIEYLENPEATFAEDAQSLGSLCEENGIAYQRSERAAAFPLWLLREFYPENP